MNGFNLATVQQIYYGVAEASSVFYGNTLIWSKETDYLKIPLTIKSLEDNNTINVVFHANNNSDIKDISYSTNNGTTWTAVTGHGYTTETITLTTLNTDETILIKGGPNLITQSACSIGNWGSYVTLSPSSKFEVYGNIMSLIKDITVANWYEDLTMGTWTFPRLFMSTSVVSTENLILPATKATTYCYCGMFHNCHLLTSAPELPATDLSNTSNCYDGMFINTAITKAPVLPATDLTSASNCYDVMFSGCTNLNDVTVLAKNGLNGNFDNWLDDTAATGTVKCYESLGLPIDSASGIPVNWTASYLDYVEAPLTIVSNANSNEILLYHTSLSDNYNPDVYYSTDNGSTWNLVTIAYPNSTTTEPIAFLNEGDKIMFKGGPNLISYNATGKSQSQYISIKSTGSIVAQGNVSSLYKDITVANWYDDKTMADYGCYGLFKNSEYLTSSQNIILPATTLSRGCYKQMFYGCAALTSTPQLPAMEVSYDGYAEMFSRCTSLTTAPNLPATSVDFGSYGGMFTNCYALVNNIPTVLPATTLGEKCYWYMFENCRSITTAPELPATTLAVDCYGYMFTGCTSLTTAPELKATTLTSGCYQGMFRNCSLIDDIKIYTTSKQNNSTYNWLYGTAATGKVTYYSSLGLDINNVSGIPTNWTAKYLDYETHVLTIKSKENFNDIKLSIHTSDQTNYDPDVYYSTDNGSTWNAAPTGAGDYTLATINTDQTILLKGGPNLISYNACAKDEWDNYISFTTSRGASVEGNALSLIRDITSPTWYENTTVGNCAYARLFSGYDTSTGISDASNLWLSMGNTASYQCCDRTFGYCEALTVGPDLPATTLTDYCYQNMFEGCIRLTAAPELPATTLGYACYDNMFLGCIALTTAPVLPATTLTDYCYHCMFQNCSSLTTAPELPATTLTYGCYYGMFQYCTSLTTAPELPATTLAGTCYQMMFYGCTSLTSAPELPATTLAGECYSNMFNECSSLSYVKVLAQTGYSSDKFDNWLNGVAATGTFEGYKSLRLPTGSGSGIPSGWTTNYYDYYIDEPLRITATSDNTTIDAKIYSNDLTTYNPDLMYSIDNGSTWNTVTATQTGGETINLATLNTGDIILFKGGSNLISYGATAKDNSNKYLNISVTGSGDLRGNALSLIKDITVSNWYQDTTINSGYTFTNLFKSSGIVNAINLVLPSTTLPAGCYQWMFENCPALTTPPELPAKTLAYACYDNMFYSCSALTKAPELPATTLYTNCYHNMFAGCSSLTTPPELPAKTLAYGCYDNMFYSCRALTKAPELPATTLAVDCYNRMFYGCSSLNHVVIKAKTNATGATSSWLYGTAATGTVECYSDLGLATGSTSGIPSGWTAVYIEQQVLTITPSESGYGVYFLASSNSNSFAPDIQWSDDDGATWNTITHTGGSGYDAHTIAYPVQNSKLLIKGGPNLISYGTCRIDDDNYVQIRCDAPHKISGNIISLIKDTTVNGWWNDNTMGQNAFKWVFSDCSNLKDAGDLILSTGISQHAYDGMFRYCGNLEKAPVLSSTTLADYCYQDMFYACSKLNYVEVLAQSQSGLTTPFLWWMDGVASSGTIRCYQSLGLDTGSISGIPTNWTADYIV